MIMKNMRIVIPNINLKKFYKICAFQEVSHSSVNLKEKSFRRYLKFRNHLFNGIVKAESYSIFIDKLRKSILSKIISNEDLNLLTDKPLNPTTIRTFFQTKGSEISKSSSKALLSLLIKVYLLDQMIIIKNISVDNEVDQDKDLIYYYILRRRDFISVKELKHKFSDYPRKHKINDHLLELWIDGRIEIDGIDVPKEVIKDYNFENLTPDLVKDYKSIELYRIRETGELTARIVIQNNYKLYPLVERG